jgi:muramoyltetrapeptide carboxypeptidase
MIKPKALEKGDTIGLIAPASPPRIGGIVDKCVKILKQQGYHVVEGESCRHKYGHLAGTDEVRAKGILR